VHKNYSQKPLKGNHFGQLGIDGGSIKIYLKEEECENMVEIHQDMVH